MTITTLSSRELNHDVTRAKRAARQGPVFITDRGRPAHVLLSFEDYQRLTQQRRNIADALAYNNERKRHVHRYRFCKGGDSCQWYLAHHCAFGRQLGQLLLGWAQRE